MCGGGVLLGFGLCSKIEFVIREVRVSYWLEDFEAACISLVLLMKIGGVGFVRTVFDGGVDQSFGEVASGEGCF